MQTLKIDLKTAILLGLLALFTAAACSDDPAGGSASIAVPATADVAAGGTAYASTCQGCHGADGTGRGGVNDITLDTYADFDALVTKIDTTMPPSDPTACAGDCARDAAAYVMCEFNAALAAGCP